MKNKLRFLLRYSELLGEKAREVRDIEARVKT